MTPGGERAGFDSSHSRLRLLVGLALLGLLATTACSGDPEQVTLLGLGDSYSSGEGTAASEGDCGRSPTAYPALVAGDLDEQGELATGDDTEAFVFVACSGAEVSDVVAQVEALDGRRFDVVTLTVGGNDVGFLDVLVDCIGADDVIGALLDGDLQGLADRGCELEEGDVDDRLGSLGAELEALYARIVDDVLAEDGTLIVLGYPHLFEDPADWDSTEGTRCDGFGSGDIPALRAAADELDDTIQQAAQKLDRVEFLDQRSVFAGHGRCSDDPWLNGIKLRPRVLSSFHPNESGHEASAEAVIGSITN